MLKDAIALQVGDDGDAPLLIELFAVQVVALPPVLLKIKSSVAKVFPGLVVVALNRAKVPVPTPRTEPATPSTSIDAIRLRRVLNRMSSSSLAFE